MKKITEIRSVFPTMNVLTSQEMANLKGGSSLIDLINAGNINIADIKSAIEKAIAQGAAMVADDKRRERPGGGISTL